ncbi:hypothetical protein [Streptomyces sp. NPDC006691]|uniref:hypothetical protein n=1 Tax=Streptomyces sp. NPDC006691 TaxID=3364757 RepID=UPI0036C5F465
MKASALVLAFLPLTVFSFLARSLPSQHFGYAALAGTVAALVALAIVGMLHCSRTYPDHVTQGDQNTGAAVRH